MKNAFLFPGQGSQIKGMGADLLSEFRDEIEKANTILCYSLEELILFDENNLLNKTLFAQPALYVISCLEYMRKIKENNIKPEFVAGHSLGEFAALFAAGVYDFETGLKIVNKRAQLMSKVENGAMAAVIGLEAITIEEIISNIDGLYIANYNSKMQTVISGTKASIEEAQNIFLESGAALYYILPINCPCHSQMLAATASKFELFLSLFEFEEPKIKIISNVTGSDYEYKNIINRIASQMCNPVRWKQSINYMLNKEVTEFNILGPSHVLQKILDKNIKEYI